MLAGRNIQSDTLFIVNHHPVGAAIDPSGVRVACDDKTPGADIAPAVVGVPQRCREFGDVNGIAFENVFEDRTGIDNPVGQRFQRLGVRMIGTRQFELVEIIGETQRQVFARPGKPVDQDAEPRRTVLDIVEHDRRRALVVAHHLDHLADIGVPVCAGNDFQIAALLDRRKPVAQIVILQGAGRVGPGDADGIGCLCHGDVTSTAASARQPVAGTDRAGPR